MPLICPDGQKSTVTLIRPKDGLSATSTTILFHSLSFDFNYVEVGAKKQYRDPTSMTRDWALRRVFTTIGHFVDDNPEDDLTGAMAQALVEQGSQVILPANCWGDLWHNQLLDEYTNNVDEDGFVRMGGEAAKWAHSLATEVDFGLGTQVPFSNDLITNRVYAVGLGEGARAVGELLAKGIQLNGAVVDSSPDDLSVYQDDPETYATIGLGLERIYTVDGKPTSDASLAVVPDLPTRTVYIYSSLDEQIPYEIHAQAVTRLQESEEHWVHDTIERGHNQSGTQLPLARQAVAHMMNAPTFEE